MHELTTLSRFGFAMLAGACFAIVYKIPTRYFAHATLIAMFARLIVDSLSAKSHIAFAAFVASFVVAGISHLFARYTRKPAQMFLIPGVMCLVPGASLYNFFSLSLAKDFANASKFLSDAMASTISISFAILLANWLIPSRKTL